MPVNNNGLSAHEGAELAQLQARARKSSLAMKEQRRLTDLKRRRRAKKRERGASDSSFESKHPRGAGGMFIKKGSSGDEVAGAQQKLGVKQSGKFDSETEKKLKEYQRKHGLVVDGIIGRQTATAFKGEAKVAPGALNAGDKAFLKASKSKSKKKR